jgi:hypothetical protein
MYVESFKHNKKSIGSDDLDHHKVLLGSELSRTAVFNQLMQGQDEIQSNESLLSLLYYTWWAEPGASHDSVTDVAQVMGSQHLELVKTITRCLKPETKTVSKGMSILARFATAPHTDTASEYPQRTLASCRQNAKIVSSRRAEGHTRFRSKTGSHCFLSLIVE